MRFRLLMGFFVVVTVITGCQGPPPTVIYLVVTSTPATTEVVSAEETPQILAPTTPPGATATPTTPPSNTPLPTTPGPTPLPANFPTPVVAQIQIAEQLFERGRMFWLEPTQQIWVLKITSEGRGTWEIYEDTYLDGEPETDPSLVPPDGRYQPERGFGKLWRESGNLRQELGWGVTPEFGYVSSYEYHAGGSVDARGVYTPGPGYHILFSLGGELFRFNEVDGTWQLGSA